MVSGLYDRMSRFEILVYAVGTVLVITTALLVAGAVYLSMDTEERIEQMEEKMRNTRW